VLSSAYPAPSVAVAGREWTGGFGGGGGGTALGAECGGGAMFGIGGIKLILLLALDPGGEVDEAGPEEAEKYDRRLPPTGEVGEVGACPGGGGGGAAC
jgi:hypothetical protein